MWSLISNGKNLLSLFSSLESPWVTFSLRMQAPEMKCAAPFFPILESVSHQDWHPRPHYRPDDKLKHYLFHSQQISWELLFPEHSQLHRQNIHQDTWSDDQSVWESQSHNPPGGSWDSRWSQRYRHLPSGTSQSHWSDDRKHTWSLALSFPTDPVFPPPPVKFNEQYHQDLSICISDESWERWTWQYNKINKKTFVLFFNIAANILILRMSMHHCIRSPKSIRILLTSPRGRLPRAPCPPPCSWRWACRSGSPRCSSRELPSE